MRSGGKLFIVTLIAGVALWGATASAQQRASADALIAAATDKLIVEGDVDAAIRLATEVVDRFEKTDRAAAARALMMLGGFHELKGDGQARRVFERLRTEFADQKNLAQLATQRLRLLGAL